MPNAERELLLQLGQTLHELRAKYDHYGLFHSGQIYQQAFRQFGEDATAKSSKIDEILALVETIAMGEEHTSTIIIPDWNET